MRMEELALVRSASPTVAVDATASTRTSAVSWPAILAGAAVAAATALLLVVLATGLGLASVSPWPDRGASAASVAVMSAIAFIVVQWVSAAVGGYLTGRLRTRWVNAHTHEVFFRDTAHGLITWAVATLIVASTLVSAASSTLGTGTRAASTVASGVAQSATTLADTASPYDIDLLFRATTPSDVKPSADEDVRKQVGRILGRGIAVGGISAGDRTYLTQLIAAQAGISDSDAQRRLDEVTAHLKADADKARAAADAARKATETASILAALSMLIGAFIASVSAALGGRLRDE